MVKDYKVHKKCVFVGERVGESMRKNVRKSVFTAGIGAFNGKGEESQNWTSRQVSWSRTTRYRKMKFLLVSVYVYMHVCAHVCGARYGKAT